MRRRNLITALAATAAFGAAAAPAHAELRRVKVTLVTGQQLTLAVDVPPGTPVDQVAFTGLPAEVQLVEDLGPVATPVPTPVTTTTAPTPTLTPAPTADPTQTPTATATPTAVPTAPADDGGAAQPPRARGNLRGNAQVLSGELRRPAATATPAAPPARRKPDGTPTPSDPTLSVATPGPALPGVPNFFIEKFRIPPFLLPIYQAAGVEYGVRWEILAAINEIETDYGRNLNVSSAGAVGWMQFIPSSWDLYGVDANQDGLADPYNPVDAIFSAARYLRAAGADQDLGRAIYAYNHADWYVDSVLLRARLIGGLPGDLVSSLTGLTQGRFPVAARSTYAEQLTRRELAARKDTTPARLDESDGRRKAIRIYARDGAPVIAVTDGRIVDMGRSAALGRFISLQDAYGNTYTYAGLGTVAARYPVPKRHRTTQADVRRELALPTSAPTPTHAASRTTRSELEARLSGSRRAARRATATAARPAKRSIATTRTTGTVSAVAKGTAAVAASGAPLAKDAPVKQRLFAHPDRPRAAATLVATHKAGLGKLDASLEGTRRLRRGSRVTAGPPPGGGRPPPPRPAPHPRLRDPAPGGGRARP